MTPWKQSNPKWGDELLGNTKLTMAKFGCLVTSLASMVDKTPSEVNKLLTLAKAYTLEGMVIHSIASKALNLTYNGFSLVPKGMCLGMTDYFANKGNPMHFVLWLGKGGQIMDPLTGLVRKCPYKLKDYRLYELRH